jgi:ATP-dependent DNA ligase
MICPAECQSIDLECAMNFMHPDFMVEEKLDGIRAMVEIQYNGKVSVTGRRWKSLGVLAQLGKCDSLRNQSYHPELYATCIDGELMPCGTFHAFDIIMQGGCDLSDMPQFKRKDYLNSIADFLPENFKIVRSFASVSEMGGFSEGVVWKNLNSGYGFGWLKAKRVETLDVIVKRILDEGVAEVEGRGKVVGVPESVKPGDMIEVEAFKVFDSGKLRNGKFVRTRDDK